MNEVNAVFDAAIAASKYLQLLDKRSLLVKQLQDMRAKVCGNCFHWMKSSCVPEKQHKQFKSCNSFGCKDFALNAYDDIVQKIEKELIDVTTAIAKFERSANNG